MRLDVTVVDKYKTQFDLTALQITLRRETARCFVSLNILLSHSKSLNTIRKFSCVFLFAFHC